MIRVGTLVACVTLMIGSAPTFGVVLYDGSLNTTPDAQGWLAYGDADPSTDYTSTSGGRTRLDTLSSNSVQAGYSNHTIFGTGVNPSFPVLDRSTGFVLSFTVWIPVQHYDLDRAGFSVIALGSDKQGIELAIQGGEVFAQNGGTSPNLFTKGESAALDSSTGYVSYDLIVGASGYQLKANGTPLLSGAIRDYSAFVPPPLAPDPYEIANYLFLGDNTTSARADTSIAYIAVAVPEPASLALVCLAGLMLAHRRR
jgi:hypothetical protein